MKKIRDTKKRMFLDREDYITISAQLLYSVKDKKLISGKDYYTQIYLIDNEFAELDQEKLMMLSPICEKIKLINRELTQMFRKNVNREYAA